MYVLVDIRYVIDNDEKTGCNRLQPVFYGFLKFFKLRQPATEPTAKRGNRNRWSGCFRLRSVRFWCFFRFRELDLQTLYLPKRTAIHKLSSAYPGSFCVILDSFRHLHTPRRRSSKPSTKRLCSCRGMSSSILDFLPLCSQAVQHFLPCLVSRDPGLVWTPTHSVKMLQKSVYETVMLL
jgi:hypothetical protein